MPLRLKVRRGDVIRVGEVLIGVDFDGPEIITVIDAPQDHRVVWTTNPGGMAITKLMAEIRTGKRPKLSVVDANASEPSAG